MTQLIGSCPVPACHWRHWTERERGQTTVTQLIDSCPVPVCNCLTEREKQAHSHIGHSNLNWLFSIRPLLALVVPPASLLPCVGLGKCPPVSDVISLLIRGCVGAANQTQLHTLSWPGSSVTESNRHVAPDQRVVGVQVPVYLGTSYQRPIKQRIPGRSNKIKNKI